MAARRSTSGTTEPPSLTASSTSITESSSEAPEGDKISGEASIPLLADVSEQKIDNMNNDNLSIASSKSSAAISRVASVETLVNSDMHNNSRVELLRKSLQVLDRDWDLGAMPGDDLNISENSSTIIEKAKGPIDIAKTVSTTAAKLVETMLGKRRRDTDDPKDSIDEKVPNSKRGKSQHQVASEEPRPKRSRLSTISSTKAIAVLSRKPSRKLVKRYYAHGIYFGQEACFDVQACDKKSKSGSAPVTSEKRAQEVNKAMPMPIFHGQRLLLQGRNFELPWDVFSPLPVKQPKPDEYKKTNKNVFIGDAAAYWREYRRPEESRCMCTIVTGCDDDCLNRTMLYECDESNCSIGPPWCTNRSFANLEERRKKGSKYDIGVEVAKTADRGHGIRANRTFQPHQIILEYTGEIITPEECDKRMHTQYKDAECYYLMDFDQGMILDATRGSMARFVNHSCSPNCRMVKWTVNGRPRMALFAGEEGVMTGDELTYDYNFSPYSVKNIQTCRCGSVNCRGVLGPKPKEIREALKPIVGAGKRKIQNVIEEAAGNMLDSMGIKRQRMNPSKGMKAILQDMPSGQKSGTSKNAKPKVKPLPKGWVYPVDAPAKVDDDMADPEAIIKAQRRKAKEQADRDQQQQQQQQQHRSISGSTLSSDHIEDIDKFQPRPSTDSSHRLAQSIRNRATNVIRSRNKGGNINRRKSIRMVDGI